MGISLRVPDRGLCSGAVSAWLLSWRSRAASMIGSMGRDRRTTLLAFARIWAYPLWRSVIRSDAADDVVEDVDWWMRCIGDAELLGLDRYSRFAYLSGAL